MALFRRAVVLGFAVALVVVLVGYFGVAGLQASSGEREATRQISFDQRPVQGVVSPTPTKRPGAVTQSLLWHTFLPQVHGPLLPLLFSDDFSNPNSGWPVADDGNIQRGYDNGEYRVLIRQPGWTYLVTPGVQGQHVQIDLDERYVGSGLGQAGVFFGMSADFSSGFAFLVSPSDQTSGLWHETGGYWYLQIGFPNTMVTVHPGNASNHLTITRTHNHIVVQANGTSYDVWAPYNDQTGFDGLIASSLSTSSNADVRFDNFIVRSLVPPTPVATAVPPPTPTAIVSQAFDAVSLQINPAHTGATAGDTLVPPLSEKWSVDLGGDITSYPVIAGGKIFALAASSPLLLKLYALDAASGKIDWGPISIPTHYNVAAATYDATNLFVLNWDGLLQSYDARTGSLRWAHQFRDSYGNAVGSTSPPVARQGIVYALIEGSSGQTLYAIDELSGAERWEVFEGGAGPSAPVLSSDAVFTSGACANVTKFARSTGARLAWAGQCSGGGGRTASYYNGRIYSRSAFDSPAGYIYADGPTLSLVGQFQSETLPAFSGNQGFYLFQHLLRSADLTGGNILWSFSGDGSLSTPPLVVGSHVYVGSSNGNLYALDVGSGTVAWSTNVGGNIATPKEQNANFASANAGDGLLVVPVGSKLIAFGGSGAGS